MKFVSITGNATVGVPAAVATELDSVQHIDDRIDNIQEPYQQLKDGRGESRHGSTSFLPRPIVDDRTAGRLKKRCDRVGWRKKPSLELELPEG